MPHWSTQIPERPRGPSFQILRTPAFKPLTAIVTSRDLLGTFTHYYKGRTTPCERPDCEACRENLPYRWHAYLTALNLADAMHFLFEVTAAGAEPFIEYRDAHGSTRGCLFQATRWKQRPNGRVLIQTKPADLTQRSLPPPPDLIKCLSILWDLPTNGLKPSNRDPQNRTDTIAREPAPIADLTHQIQNQIPPPQN